MNHLAHLFLAGTSAESLVGNLAGDFVKGTLGERFSAGVRGGIAAHRAIDAFTDSHPDVAAFRAVLVPEFKHYGRIIADVFFDHFLLHDWSRYACGTPEEFLARTFTSIDSFDGELPGRLAAVYPRMRDEGWLLANASEQGVARTLQNLSTRLSRRPQLEVAAHHLCDSREIFQHHFRAFFPEVMKVAATLNGPGAAANEIGEADL